MTRVPSSKIPKRDSGSRVSRTGVNLHQILGIRLDDTKKHTQGHMYEHIGKCAKMQRNKESQTGWHKASKASISSHEVEKGMHQANPHHRDVFSQMVATKQTTGGMDATKQTNGPKGQQAQTHRGHKTWQESRSSQTNMEPKHKSKQAYTCLRKLSKPFDVGLDVWM